MTTIAVRPFALRGWHVLLMFLAFFGVVFAVNAVFVVEAIRTAPGEVTAKPYEEGLAFNRTLAERGEERAIGWRAAIEVSQIGPGRTRLRVKVGDAAGAPVRGLKMTGRLERPATEFGRLSPAFTETRPGVYDAMAPDTPGAWDLTISAHDDKGRPLEATRRLYWK